MAPKGKPRAVPRSHGFQEREKSSRLIQARPVGMMSAGRRRRWAATHSVSPMANSPTATTTTSIPSASWGMPKVSRCWPDWRSMPTSPIISPMAREANPLMREEPSTEVTATKASTMMAK
jgi:hypothetical protein